MRIHVLPTGVHALIRPIRPQDKGLLAAGLEDLSPRSRHARFLGPKPHFTTRELRYLTEVDGMDHVALVAVDAASPDRLLGVGRWVRDGARPDRAEIAVTVGDRWQGQGLGRALGLALAEEARVRGVEHFTATMLPENEPALRLFATITSHLHTEIHAGVRELVADLVDLAA